MLQTGYILGKRYKVVKLLGQGGQSNIYLVEDTRLKGKKWVAKEMVVQYQDPRAQAQAKIHFEREAQLMATLDHVNLPKVNDYFSEAGKYYLVMEYVKGQDLERMLEKRNQPFGEEEVANYAIQVSTVLYYLHNQKPPVVFRDIKPSNIMIEGNMVKLIDFGIVRHFNPTKKGDTLRIGSPGYSPPEQYSGQTDPRSDIYSLGVTMHHLLTNRDPSKTQTPFTLPPIKALNPKVSSKMVHIVETATQLDPDKRYQNALDLKNDLREVYQGGMTRMTPAVSGTMPMSAMTRMQPAQSGLTVPHVPPGAIQSDPDDEESTPSAGVVPPAGSPSPQASPSPTPTGQPAQTPAGAPSAGTPQAPAGKKSFAGIVSLLLVLGVIAAIVFAVGNNWSKIPELISGLGGTSPTPAASSVKLGDDSLERGITLYRMGSYKEALQELRQAGENDGKTPETLLYLNNTLVKLIGGETVNINLILESGETGNSFLAGSVIAQQRINAEGGIRGKLILLTPFTLSGEAADKSRMLESAFENTPTAVITNITGENLKDAAKTAESKKVPLLALAGNAETVPGAVMVSLSEKRQYEALRQMLVRSKINRAAIVHEASIPVTELTTVLISDKSGIQITDTFAYRTDKLEFDRFIENIKKDPPGAIIPLGKESDIAFFASSLARAKISVPLFLPAWTSTDTLLAGIKGREAKILGMSPLYYWPDSFTASAYISFYRYSFNGKEPDLISACSFDLIRIAASAARQSSTEPDKVLAFLNGNEGLSRYEGVLGKPRKTGSKSAYVFQPEWWAILEPTGENWRQKGGFQVR